MERLFTSLNRLDWVMGFALIVAAAFLQNVWLLAGGTASLLIAWYNPSARMRRWLAKSMFASAKRRAAEDAPRQAAVRIDEEERAYAAQAPAARPDFSRRVAGYGDVRLHPSKHNILVEGADNLIRTDRRASWH